MQLADAACTAAVDASRHACTKPAEAGVPAYLQISLGATPVQRDLLLCRRGHKNRLWKC